MKQINVGIVGLGWAGSKHLDTLMKIDGVTVCALAAANQAKMAAAAEKVPEARQYQTAEELIEGEAELDALVVCVTPSRHGHIERMAAERGIHMYIEKPIEISLEAARETATAIERAGVITSVGYQERYNPAIGKIKGFFEDKQMNLIEGRWLGHLVGAKWWREKESSGGQIIEQSTHIFDLIRFLFGEVETVGCIAVPGYADGLPNDVERASMTMLKMESGAVASLSTGCFFKEKTPGRIGFDAYADTGFVNYQWSQSATLTDADGSERIEFEPNTHAMAVEAFVEAVKTGDRSLVLSSYQDSLKSFELTFLAEESMKNGGEPQKTAR